METYGVKTPHFIENRRQPLWYDLKDDVHPPLRVIGHYEAECGGCDTISKNPNDPDEKAMAYIFRLVREAHEEGLSVLFEGVILSTILGELPEMKDLPIMIVNLTSDLETCLAGISARRLRREKDRDPMETDHDGTCRVRKTLEEKTVKNNVGKIRSADKTSRQLRMLGFDVRDLSREDAVEEIIEVLS